MSKVYPALVRKGDPRPRRRTDLQGMEIGVSLRRLSWKSHMTGSHYAIGPFDGQAGRALL